MIREILQAPVGDIEPIPGPLPQEAMQEVLRNMPQILHKCFHCLRVGLATPLDALVSLLLKTVAGVPEPEVARTLLSTTSSDGQRCVDLMDVFFIDILSSQQLPLRNQINMEDLLELTQLLSSHAALKDNFGAKLMPALLSFLYFPANHEVDYRQPRGVACALINLLRGSRPNKNRMSAECGAIGEVLASSGDVFFQMQCVEILFRLHMHNRSVVIQQSNLPDYLKRGVTSLPNDGSLLITIQSFLDSFNAEHNANRVLIFTALRVVAGGSSEVCGPTSLYFSPNFLIVMLPGGCGDNITIPYEHVRSVKLSKDHRVVIRLLVIPAKLSSVMATMTAREGSNTTSSGSSGCQDQLCIFLTSSTMHAIRNSRVHEWIADRKRLYPAPLIEQQQQQQQQQSRIVSPSHDGIGGVESYRKASSSGMISSNSATRGHNTLSGEEAGEVGIIAASGSGGGSVGAVSSARRGNGTVGSGIVERDANVGSAQAMSSSARTADGKRVRESAASAAASLPPLVPHPTSSSSSLPGPTAIHTNDRNNDDDENNIESSIDALQQRLEAAASRHASEFVTEEGSVFHRVTESYVDRLNQLDAQDAQERSAFESYVREEVAKIRAEEEAVKVYAAECVEALNRELQDVQELGQRLRAELDGVEQGITSAASRNSAAEEEALQQLKSRMDAEMAAVEERLIALYNSSDPLQMLAAHVKDRMAKQTPRTAAAGRTGATRR